MSRGFASRLALIVAAGLALRLAYVLVVMHHVGVTGDGAEFHTLANQLARGDGYIEPLVVAAAHLPTADKPPLYPLLLALPSWLGWTSLAAHRIASCLMGASLVAAIGLLGRRAAGERVGLAPVAAAAAACALVLAPWVIRNWTQFDRPIVSTNVGSLAYGANCHAAYYTRLIGTWPCYPPLRATPRRSEADVSAELRRRGVD